MKYFVLRVYKLTWVKPLEEKSFRLEEADIERLISFPSNPVPSACLHLVRAKGLSEIYELAKESKRFKEKGFQEAIRWRNERGCLSAIYLALSWIGIESFVVQERGNLDRWFSFQIGLEKPVSKETLRKIRQICKLSAPLRANLERVFVVGKNKKILNLSDTKSALSSGATLSSDFGVLDGDFVNDAT